MLIILPIGVHFKSMPSKLIFYMKNSFGVLKYTIYLFLDKRELSRLFPVIVQHSLPLIPSHPRGGGYLLMTLTYSLPLACEELSRVDGEV